MKGQHNQPGRLLVQYRANESIYVDQRCACWSVSDHEFLGPIVRSDATGTAVMVFIVGKPER